MKNLIIVLFVVLLTFGSASSTESITGLSVNSPVPIDKELVITGTYSNTDTNNSFYCKFGAVDDLNIVFDRFTDELTFPDGTFYSAKTLHEPKYWRSTQYIARVHCGNVVQDINFSVSQRESLDNFFFGEIFYLWDNSTNLIFFLIFTVIIVGIIGVVYTGITGAFPRIL